MLSGVGHFFIRRSENYMTKNLKVENKMVLKYSKSEKSGVVSRIMQMDDILKEY